MLSGSTIIHVGQYKQDGNQIVLNYKMKPNSSSNKFKVKIDKTQDRKIYIGIVPYAKATNKHTY